MGKKYVVLGGGGSFGLHTCRYLLEKPETERVLSIGRNVPKPEPFSLSIGANDKRYAYHSYHITYEGLKEKELFLGKTRGVFLRQTPWLLPV